MPTENNGWKPNGLDRLMIKGTFYHQWAVRSSAALRAQGDRELAT